jgi:hypothetical protein
MSKRVRIAPKNYHPSSLHSCWKSSIAFPQIRTVDLTGGAPEMNYGFRPLVERSHALGKEIIVRSNLTIFFEPGYEDLPEPILPNTRFEWWHPYPVICKIMLIACAAKAYTKDSIRAIQQLNALGYGTEPLS